MGIVAAMAPVGFVGGKLGGKPLGTVRALAQLPDLGVPSLLCGWNRSAAEVGFGSTLAPVGFGALHPSELSLGIVGEMAGMRSGLEGEEFAEGGLAGVLDHCPDLSKLG